MHASSLDSAPSLIRFLFPFPLCRSAYGTGDFSNNAKYMVTGGWEREGAHYRAGLNSIPLWEEAWGRQQPAQDDHFFDLEHEEADPDDFDPRAYCRDDDDDDFDHFATVIDDSYSLRVAASASAAVLASIDDDGAASMAFHTHPFILEHDPYSG